MAIIRYKPVSGLNDTSLNKLITISGKDLADKPYVDEKISGLEQSTETKLQNKVNKTDNKEYKQLQPKLATETNYTGALQRTIDSCQVFDTIILPSTIELIIDEVTITKPINIINGLITGGSLVIDVDKYESNMVIDNVTFKGMRPLIIKQLRGADIKRCRFYGNDKSIYFQPYVGGQGIARIKIYDNLFIENNYDLYADEMTDNNLAVADIHFTNNMCKWSKISHIDLHVCDGAVITGNTFFCPSVNTKMHHINIRHWANWLIICNNNFFEAGAESIKLSNPVDFTICNNNFAWNGQYHRAPHITIYNQIHETVSWNCIGKICQNTFAITSQGAVQLIDVDYVVVTDNVMQLEPNSSKWKGTEELDINKHFGVYVENKFTNELHMNIRNLCNVPTRELNFPEGVTYGNYEMFMKKVITDSSVTKVEGYLNLVRAAADITIEEITNANEGHEITIMSGNASNVVIKNSDKIILNNSIDAYLRPLSTLKLIYINGKWQEVSRIDGVVAKTKTIDNDASNIVIDTELELLALNNPNPTTITDISGSGLYNGKEINIITFNDNSTISASSTIYLNEATTLELRKGARRTAKMVYYDKIWYLL